MKLKERIGSVFGTVLGTVFRISSGVVYYIVTFLLSILPLVMLDLPFWADFLIILGVNLLNALLFGIPELALWIVGLVAAIHGKQDAWAIAYYVVFGINALKILLVFVGSVISSIIDKRY